ncbi:MAG: tryptophan 7-halogenase [Ktedonobacteraceae bacterium]
MKSFDVIIIGGGPAGAAAAIALLKRGYSVLIVERSHYEGWRVGETLPPHACMPLSALDAWNPFAQAGHLPSPATYAAWGSAELYPTHFIFNPYGHAWHLDRARFDALLAQSAEGMGAMLLQGTRVINAVYTERCWQLLVKNGEETLHLEASFLVDATGRVGWLARSLAVKRIAYDTMLALIGVLSPQDHSSSLDPVLHLEATEDGWWYSAPVPDGSLVVACMTDRDYLATSDLSPAAFWRSQLQHTVHTLARSCDLQSAGEHEVHVKSASTFILERPAGGGWVAVGDAASTYDPLSAEGITKALRSGLRAAEAIHASLHSEAEALNNYVIEVANEFNNYLAQRTHYYSQETRWPASPFWRRRQAARAR